MSVARVKLKEDLDKMTKVAAFQENRENIKKFDDIISFDANEDVFFTYQASFKAAHQWLQ